MVSEDRIETPAADVAVSASDQSKMPQADSTRLQMSPGKIIALGVVGGGLFVVICIAIFPVFELSERLARSFPPPEVAVEREATILRYQMYHAIIALSIFGALMGSLLALGESLARGARGRGIMMVVLAIIIGAAFGAFGAFAGHMLQTQLKAVDVIPPMGRSVLVQMLTLALLGGGLGLAVGLAAGGGSHVPGRAALGATAGLLSGLLFPVVCAFVASKVKTEVVVPGGVVWGRAEWIGLVIWVALFVIVLAFILPMEHQRKRADA